MPTIADIAGGEDFSILLSTVLFIDAEIPEAGLATALSSPGALTVFAPNNAAFGQLAADLGFAGDVTDTTAVTTFLTDTVPAATLRAVVEYHVLPGAQSSTDIAGSTSLTTLQGGTITPDLPTLVDNEPDLIDPSLVATDIMADNGIVHVIDRVLLPIDLPGNDAPTFTQIVLDTSGASGFDTNGGDFDMLREAVVATNLAATLDDETLDWTVFAPTDDAFVGLSQTLGYDGGDEGGALTYLLDSLRLLSKGEDPGALLKDVLLYHVSGESLQASQVLTGDPIPTLLGADLGVDGVSLVDADPDLPNPNLIATDIQAANGVLHVLDGVLLPADLLQSDGSNDVDFVIADDGRNKIRTGEDNDFIDAKGGHDLVAAGWGDDVVLAGSGHDRVYGGKGDDHIAGEGGRDKLFGGWGNDMISGGNSNDRLIGQSGHDTLDGGTGNDLLVGGSGNDVFVFGEDNGHDRAIDFGWGHDVIDVSALDGVADVQDLDISFGWFTTRISHDEGSLTLYGWRHLDNDDFLFA